ncbi:MAG: GH3 auxin-responsive promoter family protein [Clostridia bacterium]|nr:GH3 auxin-responsive promoter family protein [Clostridia bacterium]
MGIVSDYGVFLGNYAFRRFDHYTTYAMDTQLRILRKIMHDNKDCELGKKYGFAHIDNIRDYQDKVPLSTFEDYAPLIDRMIENGETNIITSQKIVRYTSSSGSVGKPKLQPKTGRDLWNMQCCGFAATPGCADRYFRRQGVFKKLPGQMGPMLMSLNGTTLENGMLSNGAGQVPFTFLKPVLKYFITTPMDILYPEDEEGTETAYFQLRFALVNKNVTYIGAIVITLITSMFDYLEKNWEMICDDIEHGTIDPCVKCPDKLRKKYGHMKPDPERAAELREIFKEGFDKEPVAPKIWPKLCWGYGMTSSTLAVYAEKLKRYVGDLPMHNMGYGASEGFMAMPVELNASDYVLLPRSLFYEFLPVDAPEGTRPLTLDQIEVGKDYEIIVTNFSGLYRYRIMDIVRCTGTYNNSKKIEFLYRSNMGLNTANEKTTTQMLDAVANQMQKHFDINFIGFSYYSDVDAEPKRYVLLIETADTLPPDKISEMEEFMHEAFKKVNEKYEKYCSWGLLGQPKILQLRSGAYDEYKQSIVAKGRVLNQIKPVTVINTDERKEFFFSRIKPE